MLLFSLKMGNLNFILFLIISIFSQFIFLSTFYDAAAGSTFDNLLQMFTDFSSFSSTPSSNSSRKTEKPDNNVENSSHCYL